MNVISEETAQETLDQFTAYYDMDIEGLPDALNTAMVFCLNQIKRAVEKGKLEIEITDDTIVVKQHLKKEIPRAPNPLVYKEVNASAKLAMKDDGTQYGRIYALLGALSGEGSAVILKLKGADMSLAESLGTVFLQV